MSASIPSSEKVQSASRQDGGRAAGCRAAQVERLEGSGVRVAEDWVAAEEPLAIEIVYGPRTDRRLKSLAITMRTPGADDELAAGFLLTEGIVRDGDDIEDIRHLDRNAIRLELAPGLQFNLAAIERNFYRTSSCGICGKASLLALETLCPPRRQDDFFMETSVLYTLAASLRGAQSMFHFTGGLHACGLFDAEGDLQLIREDIGRHNALDKLIGASVFSDKVPLRQSMVLFSGRASFELLQKAVMAGIPMVAAVGAPSSLAVSVARRFDITMVGFLRDDHCNVYHGAQRIRGLSR